MIIRSDETADIAVPGAEGAMRLHLFRPAMAGRFPAVAFYSEIYQVTDPIRRLAAMIAGHGYLVAVPEVYHEYEAPGTVLRYDQPGTDRGNALKFTKKVEAFDADARETLSFLERHEASTGRLATMGVCLGGHLAFRAALQPEVVATTCFYATGVHSGELGADADAGTLARAHEISGELLLIFGARDPHVPREGRDLIARELERAGTNFALTIYDAEHAFMRDEGPRYDPELTARAYAEAAAFFRRALPISRPSV